MLGESGEGASRKCDCAHEPFTPAKLWLCGRLSCGTGRCYDARKLRVWAPALLPGPGISHFVHSVARASLPHLSESRRQLPARGTLRRWINVAQSADMPRPAAALSRSLRTRPSRSGGGQAPRQFAGIPHASRPLPPFIIYGVEGPGTPANPKTPATLWPRPLHPQGAAPRPAQPDQPFLLAQLHGPGTAAAMPALHERLRGFPNDKTTRRAVHPATWVIFFL